MTVIAIPLLIVSFLHVCAKEPKQSMTGYKIPAPFIVDPIKEIKAQGIVSNNGGEPLIGVTVTIKGTRKLVVTNRRGEFYLGKVPINSVLVISYVGYSTEQRIVRDTIPVRISMIAIQDELDSLVVKGYYTTSRRLNTGNVSTVKDEDIQKQPVTDPLQALEGRVPGLYIQQTSGVPGAYSTVRIRGQNSIANGNDPLYIIDGVPFSSGSLTSTTIGGGILGSPSPGNGSGKGMSPFTILNPADIESIEVLKDADATAIYGSRGANGVILITTKKGKVGETQIDVNVNKGSGKVTRMLNMLNTSQYLKMRREAYKNDDINYLPGGAYDVNGVWDTTRYTDWQKVLIGNSAKFLNTQMNISGGNPNTQFVIGGSYNGQETVFPGDYSDSRATVHVNISHLSPNQRLAVQFSANYANDKSQLPPASFVSNINLAPDAPALYDMNDNLNWQPFNGVNTWTNPLAHTHRQAKATTENLAGNMFLSYQLLPGLQLKSSLGYSHEEMTQSNLTPSSSIAPPDDNNPALRSNNFATTSAKTWIIEPQVEYRRKVILGELNIMAGATYQENSMNSLAQTASGFTSDALISNPMAASKLILLGTTNTLYHYTALFSRISYTWEEKYIVNVAGRRDGSSRFGSGKQFGNFGAIGMGWIFTKEPFARNWTPLVSFGKLRTSYGITGNDQIADYQYLSTYTPFSMTYLGVTGLNPTRVANPSFGWEEVKKLEVALELGFFKDRLLFSASFYRNRTGNQLVGYSLPTVSGFTAIQANLPAVLQNTGHEFTVNMIIARTKVFSWISSFNLSIPENKLISYPGIEKSAYNTTYAVGHSLFSRYVYHYTSVNSQTGLYSFATKNGSGIPAGLQDQVISRPITQQCYGGIQNSIHYHNFQLDVFIQFVKQTAYDYLTYFSMPGFNGNQPTAVLDRWQKAGDNAAIEKYSTIPTTAYSAYRNLLISDAAIRDASFIRIKNLELAYQLPAAWQNKIHWQHARVYLQCQNLFTFTHYQGLDPETGANLPPLRIISTGFRVAL